MNEESLFAAAVELSGPAERQAFLDRECAGDTALRQRVERLLAADRQTDGILSHGAAAVLESSVPAPLAAGELLAGRFKLRQLLGAGGMGEVWVADQFEPVQRRIALKLIRPGLDSAGLLARFEQERQALALMDHPNIARILDAGTIPGVRSQESGVRSQGTDSGFLTPDPCPLTPDSGRPYFVMELIKGVPITEYCDANKLSPRERLALFADVCRAVQHAHQKGVIHRDLKPSNVLVAPYDGKPVVKVIDFGVAKATGERLSEHSVYTEVGAVIGTLEYMSPEQAELNNLDIDTRSDIYALGVLLYELLTGGVPHPRQELRAVPFVEMLRIIKEVEPPRPSTRLECNAETLPAVAAARQTEPKKLPALVRGELDWIVMRCLEKDRSRRYETANALALDVSRYLADEPVLAGPPSAGYRLRKFARRHRHLLTAAGAFVSLLVAAVVALSVALVAVNRERQEKVAALEAEGKRRQQARAALDDLSSQLVGDWLARQTALLPEYKRFLERALRSYEEFAADTGQDEESRAGVALAYWRVGKIRERLGQRKEAEAAWLRCRDLHTRLADDFPANPAYRHRLAQVYIDLNDLYLYTGQSREAEAVSGQAVTVYRLLAADAPGEPAYRLGLAQALNHRGASLLANSRAGEAEAAYGEALDLLNRLGAESSAEPAYRRELAQTHMGLGYLLRAAGRPRRALGHYEQAVAIDRQLVAKFPGRRDNRDSLARGLTNLGNLLEELERRPEAEAALRETLTIQRKLVADYPGVPFYRKGLAMTLNNLGTLLKHVDKTREAEELYREALTLFTQLVADDPKLPEHHNDAAGTMVNLAMILFDRKDFPAARRLLDEALPHHQVALKANARHPAYCGFYRNNRRMLAQTLLELKDHAAAAAATREFLEATVEPPRDAYTAACLLAGCAWLAAQDERLAEGRQRELATMYGDSALAALRQAIEKGAEEVTEMAKDPALDPLRLRPDFQKLVGELEAKRKLSVKEAPSHERARKSRSAVLH